MLSIIVATFNSFLTLERTLKSLSNQSVQEFEIIFIDGGSTDRTVELIQHFRECNSHLKSKFLTEKDDGIYDALNKGISIASGDYICVLHSDDYFVNNAVEIIYRAISISRSDCLLFPIKIFADEKLLGKYPVPKFVSVGMLFGHMPPHPGMVIRRGVFEKMGYYNSSYRIAGDFEFFLRYVISGGNYCVVDDACYCMLVGGVSSSGFGSFMRITFEISSIYRNLGFKFPYTRALLRVPLKILLGGIKRRFK